MTISPRWLSGFWMGPALLAVPFLMGADGNGCGGAVFHGKDGGGPACAPADCAGMGAPAIAKLCPDGSSVSESVCVEQPDGTCGWGFPACPSGDGGASDSGSCSHVALPCIGCPYGSTGSDMTADGCYTCPTCLPAPDAGSVDAGNCSHVPLPCAACPYGSTGSDMTAAGCYTCPTCLPAPDAGSSCATSSDCPTGETCGFPEAEACAAKGSCFSVPAVECLVYQAGCACDGTEFDLTCTGLPSGYSLKPLKNAGPCTK
jgi:hypothetical protein